MVCLLVLYLKFLFLLINLLLFKGHEIVGFENIPDKGPGLLVYYHAAIPIDFYYVYSKTCLYKNRLFKVVADKLLFKVPGIKILFML
jgi:1-acyl-sn-glycerol-3-phosphate acyltransferase